MMMMSVTDATIIHVLGSDLVGAEYSSGQVTQRAGTRG
jgi:hypothetical protein